jgi:flagellar L-ring protein precursor FlgH
MMTALCALPVCAGSIYKEAARKKTDFFSDFRAKKTGDIVTILIVENNSASESSTVDTEKEHDFNFVLNSIFGAGEKLFGKEDGTNLTSGNFSASNEFGGQSEVSSEGQVTATLAATVKEVMPNGNLLIEGRRAIMVNKEQKNIILTGMVRPRDITSLNTVRSTHIADASITFEGFGEVTDQSKPGLLSKLLNLIPLF